MSQPLADDDDDDEPPPRPPPVCKTLRPRYTVEANLQTYRGSSTERRLLEQRIRQATAARRREARVLAGGKDHVRLNAGLPSPRRVHSARTTRPAKIVMPEPGTSAAAQLEKRMAELEQEAEEMFRRAAAERQDAERKAQAAEAAKVARQSPRGGAAPTAGPTAAQAARHTAPEADGATPRPSGLGAAVLAAAAAAALRRRGRARAQRVGPAVPVQAIGLDKDRPESRQGLGRDLAGNAVG